MKVNVKMGEIEDELIELPRNINSANQELMLESMRYCYERLRQNSKRRQMKLRPGLIR